MKRIVYVIAALSLLFGTASTIFAQAPGSKDPGLQTQAQAQDKPNFSGKWTVRLPDGVLPPPTPFDARIVFGELGQGGTIEQTEKTITVVTVANGVQTRAVFSLDGTEAKSPVAFGGGNTVNRVSTAKWSGSSLVLTTTTTFNGTVTQTSQTWTLDEVGDLIVESTASVKGKPTTTTTKYQR